MTDIISDIKSENGQKPTQQEQTKTGLGKLSTLNKHTQDMQNISDLIQRPDPPIVGKVTHCSIELYWTDNMNDIEKKVARRLRKEERLKVTLQEQDRHGQWVNVYA